MVALARGTAPAPAESRQVTREVPYVAFDRHELSEILKVYGRMVAVGEWRDYAIDHLPDRAVFSIFRRSSEVPLYRVEKNPKLARRQGAYSVIAQTGMILKRGAELARVLRVIDKSWLSVAE
ncbi:DUF2794 domain-containing protein [Pleomorphomonas diazotrophica]|uniref:DUF2794 domain-containing protein n=1 Tax=Pleomorphomonas diazotrophica TaxID=1166257 RepID=A0A2N3LU57_9HYPH|nr:DUF2794 domain-containing protein [Pleomorphomonas diazotrophica]